MTVNQVFSKILYKVIFVVHVFTNVELVKIVIIYVNPVQIQIEIYKIIAIVKMVIMM